MVLSPIELKIVFSDVVRGYTRIQSSLGEFYLKHMDIFVTADMDSLNLQYLKKAKDEGLMTLEEKKRYLIENKFWSSADDKKIEEQKRFVDSMEVTRTKLHLPSDINQIKAQIAEVRKEIKMLEAKYAELIGTTAESYALKKASDQLMFQSCFKTSELKEKFFTDLSFNELENYEIEEVIVAFNKITETLSSHNLRCVALSNLFLNSFYLCNDDPYVFFGKPVVNLTFPQIELFGYGRHFKFILSEHKNIPEDVATDPEKLIDWHTASKNAQQIIDKNAKPNMNTSLVGATKEDIKTLNLDQGGEGAEIDLVSELKKKGSLSMQDLLKLEFGQ